MKINQKELFGLNQMVSMEPEMVCANPNYWSRSITFQSRGQ